MSFFYGKDIYKMDKFPSDSRWDVYIATRVKPVGVCADGREWWVMYEVPENVLPQRFDICCGEAIPIPHPDMHYYDEYMRRLVVVSNYFAYVRFGEKEYNHRGKVTRPY